MSLSTIVSNMQDYKDKIDKETNVIIYFAKSYQLIFFTNFTGQQKIKQTSFFQRQNNFFWNVAASKYVNNMYDLFPDEFLSCSKEDYCAKLVL